jgi:hypothetical protein
VNQPKAHGSSLPSWISAFESSEWSLQPPALLAARIGEEVREVQIGQRYRKVDAIRTIWRVIDVGDRIGIRHCYIVDENDPTNIKLISEMTLTNPRFYHPVEPTDAARKID